MVAGNDSHWSRTNRRAMFLNREEVARFTGYRQRKKQIEALAVMGVRFFLPPDGWPRVLREDLHDGTKEEEPDFSAL